MDTAGKYRVGARTLASFIPNLTFFLLSSMNVAPLFYFKCSNIARVHVKILIWKYRLKSYDVSILFSDR